MKTPHTTPADVIARAFFRFISCLEESIDRCIMLGGLAKICFICSVCATLFSLISSRVLRGLKVEACGKNFCARVLKNKFEIYPSITDVFLLKEVSVIE